MAYVIDNADFDDTEDICAVQIASIEHMGAPHYTTEEITAWLQGVGICQIASSLEDEDKEIFVARDDNSLVMGFCALKGNQVTDIFVDPAYAGKGIGTALIKQAETFAVENGRRSLRLLSTLNSVTFYNKCGFKSLGKSEFPVNDETTLAVREMRKPLMQNQRG